MTLGEVLDGDRMAVSMYNISFKQSFERKTLCTNELEEPSVVQLRHAIEDLYYFEFIYGKAEHITPFLRYYYCHDDFQMTFRLEGL